MANQIQSRPVFRIESSGEFAEPFPSLAGAMLAAPQHSEAVIATSPGGVVLAEAAVASSSRKRLVVHYEWRTTVAGQDVLTGCVRGGMRRAS